MLGGNELGPLLSALIIQRLGMSWAFWIMGAIVLFAEIPMLLTMSETKYTGLRLTIMPESENADDNHKNIAAEEIEKRDSAIEESRPEVRRRSHFGSLALWQSGDPEVNLLHAFLRPFVLLAYPTVLWSCCVYGLSLSWNVIIGASLAQLFTPPPYNFDPQDLGLCWLGPLIGSLFGTYLCGPLADRVANFYTRRNFGIREPEMRLPTCAIAAVITFLGALMLGLGLHYEANWAVSVVGLGTLSAGAQMGATLAMSYSLDIHKEVSVGESHGL